MSDGNVSPEDVGLPRDFDVNLLTTDLLDRLSDRQALYVSNMLTRRKSPAVTDRVMAAMKGEEGAIIAGLGRFPPVYVSPEIEFFPGLKVRFRSYFSTQTDDVYDAVQEFVRGKNAAEGVAQNFFQKVLLVHAIEHFNGEPFGGTVLSEGYATMCTTDPEKADSMLKEFRKKRLSALRVVPDSVVNLLIHANSVFQSFYDNVVSLRGDTPEEVEDKSKKLVEAVGNSTGPQVAGQTQT